MSIKGWIWKSAVAGFAGSVVHLVFMYAKLRLGILPTFQPYPAMPGQTGAAKGLTFGLIGWLFMGLIFFPVIGLGPFAAGGGARYRSGYVVARNGSDLQRSARHRVHRA